MGFTALLLWHIDAVYYTVAGHYYSISYALIKQVLDARQTQQRLDELFCRGNCVAGHVRPRRKGGLITLNQHMPEAHQKYREWSPQRFRQWAEKLVLHQLRWLPPS